MICSVLSAITRSRPPSASAVRVTSCAAGLAPWPASPMTSAAEIATTSAGTTTLCRVGILLVERDTAYRQMCPGRAEFWPSGLSIAGIAFDDARLAARSSHNDRMKHRMLPDIGGRVVAVLMIVALAAASAPLTAQWLKYPSPRAPRTAGGDVGLSAATPRLPYGRPHLSGVWMTADPACVIRGVL